MPVVIEVRFHEAFFEDHIMYKERNGFRRRRVYHSRLCEVRGRVTQRGVE